MEPLRDYTPSIFSITIGEDEDIVQPLWRHSDKLAINNAAGYAAGDTSLVVDNGAYFRSGDLVKVPRTGETIKVTTVVSNTLTVVVRSWGTVAAAALVDNDPLLIIGNVNEEGATSRAIKSVKTDLAYNYCQIFREPFGATETDKNSEMYGEKSMAELRFDHGLEILKQIELAFWFGERVETSGTTHPVRSTGGVNEFITTNVKDVAGTLSEAEFEDFCRMLFAKGSDTKFLFCAPLVISVINGWAKGKLEMKPADKTYGIAISDYKSGHGTLNIIEHKLFEGDVYGGMAIGLDLENLQYRPLQTRDVKLKTNIQANDEDAEKDEYIAEVGLQLALEETAAKLIGVTG